MSKSIARFGFGLFAGVLLCLGCSDEGEADGTTSTSGPGGMSGDGGAGATGGGGAAEGGGGATEGGGGQGSGGCLDAGVTEGFFTLEGETLCVVDVLTADGLDLPSYGTTPTWGGHGGPLTFQPRTGGVTLQRWSETADGVLTADETDVDIAGLPGTVYWGPIALEVPTPSDGAGCDAGTSVVVSWTGTDFLTEGAVVTIVGTDASSQVTAGTFGMTRAAERLYITSLSEVGGPTEGTLGLYAGDAKPNCDTPGFMSDGLVDTWGSNTGPAATDSGGNLFAIMTDFAGGDQELRAFPADDVSAGPIAGTPLATLEGYGDAIAVVAPEGASEGLVVVQPNVGVNGDNGELLYVGYTVDGAGAVTVGTEGTFADVTVDNDNVVLFTDDEGRLWVGLTRGAEEDMPVSTFFVLARPPA